MDNTILLIDGSSFIFRAFYALKELTAPNGMPTNAIYGVVNMLKQLEKRYKTQHWVCVFDAKGKTFRDDIYPEYKANRRETPEDLVVQFKYIHELVADLGIPVIIQEGVEADDVIATIAKKYAALDYKIIIATGDKDFAQVVNDKVILVNTMSNETLDVAGVEAKFGVKPEQIIDYLSLVGDTADNVPGVHKCGPKTAQKWLQEYGSIANLILNQDKLGGVVGANFRAAIDWLPTAQKLITIDDEVQIKETDINQIENLQLKPENLIKLVDIYRELNFRSWLKEAEAKLQAIAPNLQPKAQQPVTIINTTQTDSLDLFSLEENVIIDQSQTPITTAQLKLIQSADELETIVDTVIKSSQSSAFHIILNDYTDYKSAISTVVIATTELVYVIPLNSSDSQELIFSEDSESLQKMATLSKYWQNPCPKISYNIKQQLYILELQNIQPQGIYGDLALASYLQNSSQSQKLAAILQRFNPESNLDQEILLGKGAKRNLFTSLSQADQVQFAFQIGQQILAAHQQLVTRMSAEEVKLYQDVELPLSELLYRLEKAGMLIDSGKLREISQEMHSRLLELAEQIYLLAETPFNINSPKQLQDILFTQLKLPTTGIKKNIAGYSTDEESLNILVEAGYPIAELLLEYRYLSKLLNTYIDKLPSYADVNGLVHTSLEQTVVTSGRLSSKDPNLQNIPVRSHYGQLIRECFIAKPNHQLICADYSQIELRILAHISNDSNLIDAFKSGADIHLATAGQIFNKPLTEVSKDERRYAKTINFGLIYGKSVFGLAKELKIERAAAKLYIDTYFAQYPKVKDYMEDIKLQAHNNEFVTTIYGRKIYLPNVNSKNNILRQAEERLALNAPMQGSAADIIKIAMLHVDKWIKDNKLKTEMILQVHDELIFQVPDAEVELVLANLERLMTETIQLNVPLLVEVKAANNWGNAH